VGKVCLPRGKRGRAVKRKRKPRGRKIGQGNGNILDKKEGDRLIVKKDKETCSVMEEGKNPSQTVWGRTNEKGNEKRKKEKCRLNLRKKR